jgi:hypothetical protein
MYESETMREEGVAGDCRNASAMGEKIVVVESAQVS